MEIIKALKMRIYPDDSQKAKIDKTIGSCRFIYNHMLDRNIKAYSRRKEHLTYNNMQNLLPIMKDYLPWCNCQPKIEPHHQFKNEPPINVLNMVDGSFT